MLAKARISGDVSSQQSLLDRAKGVLRRINDALGDKAHKAGAATERAARAAAGVLAKGAGKAAAAARAANDVAAAELKKIADGAKGVAEAAALAIVIPPLLAVGLAYALTQHNNSKKGDDSMTTLGLLWLATRVIL
jgi:hypothetical protein